MHSMTTNDGRFYEKYEKFRPNYVRIINPPLSKFGHMSKLGVMSKSGVNPVYL